MARVREVNLAGIQNTTRLTATFVHELRGYHVYMKYWIPNVNEKLYGVYELDNPYDPNCVAFVNRDPGERQTITERERDNYGVVGHIPIEISKIAKSFINRNGTLTARVVDPKLHRSN